VHLLRTIQRADYHLACLAIRIWISWDFCVCIVISSGLNFLILRRSRLYVNTISKMRVECLRTTCSAPTYTCLTDYHIRNQTKHFFIYRSKMQKQYTRAIIIVCCNNIYHNFTRKKYMTSLIDSTYSRYLKKYFIDSDILSYIILAVWLTRCNAFRFNSQMLEV